MQHIELTARQRLEYRGGITYFAGLLVIAMISAVFQIITNVPWNQIVPGLFVNGFNLALALVYMLRKRSGLHTMILPWILATTTVCMPLIVKLGYARNSGWTFALQSYNSTAGLITFMLLLYLFYRSRIFLVYNIIGIGAWAAFFFVGIAKGADVHFVAVDSAGLPLISGIIFHREMLFW